MSDETDEVIVAHEVCGCCAAVIVLSGDEVAGYEFAARQAKAGLKVETWPITRFRATPLYCDDHPNGPTWWKRNGGNGKKPTEYTPQQIMGL